MPSQSKPFGSALTVGFTLVLAIAAGCASPAAGTHPLPLAAVAPAAAPARLQGVVEFNGGPVVGATMRAFDLATGREVPLIAAGGQNLIAAGGQNLIAAGGQNLLTDAAGRFDYALPTTSAAQLVKLVAQREGVTLVSLFDGAGNVVGDPPALGYRLKQGNVAFTVKVKLTAATTAAAKSFEGAFKLQFQLKEPATQAGLEGLFARVNRAVKAIEQAFAKQPALAREVAAAVNASGELPDNAAFQAVIDKAGLLDQLLDEVKGALESFTQTGGQQEQKAGLDAISSEDFPLGRVELATTGEFTYTDPDGTVVTGTVENSNLVPEPTPPPSPAATAAAPAATTAPAASTTPNRRRDEPELTESPTASGTIHVNTDTESPGPVFMSPRPPSNS
jgi:hypothetical protein